jgi:hypothetical protein
MRVWLGTFAREGVYMPTDTLVYMVWAHRSADSIFGAAANPVMRNGAFLYFDSEEKARAETDRLNARSDRFDARLI